MAERGRPAGAEALRGELDLLADRGERRHDQEDRERQHVLHEPEHDGGEVVDQLERAETELPEQRVENALLPQHDQPAVAAHDLPDEEGQEQRDQQRLARERRAGAHQGVGVGEGEAQRQPGHQHGGEQRAPEHPRVERLVDDRRVVGERVLLAEAVGGEVELVQPELGHRADADRERADEQECRHQEQPRRPRAKARGPQRQGQTLDRVEQRPAPRARPGGRRCPREAIPRGHAPAHPWKISLNLANQAGWFSTRTGEGMLTSFSKSSGVLG